jgi:hypothetical protein
MLKENINKIDYELKNLFENVKIFEKSNKSNYYFEINAFAHVDYGGDRKDAQVKVSISKPDLEFNKIKWSYLTNPLNENSDVILRVSNIDHISFDIYEVLLNKRMEDEYFESLESVYDLITESVIVEKKEDLEKKLEDILKKFEIENTSVEESKYSPDGNKPEKTLLFLKDLKMSDKFLLESELKSIGIDYVSFSGSTIKIKL